MPQVGQQFGKAAAAVAAGSLLVAPLAAGPAPAAGPQEAVKAETKVITVQKVVTPAQAKDVVFEQLQVVPAGAVNGLGVNVERAVRAMVLRFAPILRAELRQLTLAARPDPDQRRAIALEAGRALKEYARTQAGGNLGNVAGVVGKAALEPAKVAPAPVVANRVVARVDPRKLIHDAVEVAARAKLTPEQFARYQEELDRKLRDRREAVLVNVVAKLDALLSLGEDQREKLQEALRTHWDDRNFPTVEAISMYEQYYPMIQDVLILPILSEGQKQIWGNAQKINFASIRVNMNGQAGANPNLVEAELARDPDLKAALEPEVTQ